MAARQNLAPLNSTMVELQKCMAEAIVRPTVNESINPSWLDGSKTADFAARFIKPNSKMTSLERLEVYNQQYWYRLLDSLCDDFPGLRAVLGEAKFQELCTSYLDKYRSSCFTLRNLGMHLAKFVEEEKNILTDKDKTLVLDTINFEWAEIEAFDSSAKNTFKASSLAAFDPSHASLKLQPHISVLSLSYAIDEFILSLQKVSKVPRMLSAQRGREKRQSQSGRPKRQNIFVVVHRHRNIVYYKRINEIGYIVLSAIKSGNSLAGACALAAESIADIEGDIAALLANLQSDFSLWVELGWFYV